MQNPIVHYEYLTIDAIKIKYRVKNVYFILQLFSSKIFFYSLLTSISIKNVVTLNCSRLNKYGLIDNMIKVLIELRRFVQLFKFDMTNKKFMHLDTSSCIVTQVLNVFDLIQI